MWYPCFGLLMISPLGFKARAGSRFGRGVNDIHSLRFTSGVCGQHGRKDFCTHGTNGRSYLFYIPIDFSPMNWENVLGKITTAFILVKIEQLKITKITAIWYWSTFSFYSSPFFRHFQPLGFIKNTKQRIGRKRRRIKKQPFTKAKKHDRNVKNNDKNRTKGMICVLFSSY